MPAHATTQLDAKRRQKTELTRFDQTLRRLQTDHLAKNEHELETLMDLSHILHQAMQKEVASPELLSRFNQFMEYAFSRGYDQHTVENLCHPTAIPQEPKSS